jgi:NAD(P)-dependent dehydrogenase (short-subunit alcohol dehydrogenase family)
VETDEFDLLGAVAVVTGATRGIGRQTALALGRNGARVVVVGRTTNDAPHPVLPGTLESVARELHAEGAEVRSVQADLTDESATQRVVDCVLDWYGRCDVLVNNAAFTSNGSVLEIPWRRWEKGFRVQVTAPLQLVQGFVPGMFERGRGRVVNVSSEAAVSLGPGVALYSVTKHAMERLNDYLDYELHGRGVSFNSFRIDVAVTTETFRYVYDTEGAEVASLGGTVTRTAAPQDVARQIEWMVRQPAVWSGNVVGCHDIVALGGPAL